MNKQPFTVPPRRWESQLSPFLFRLFRPWRNRTLRRTQRITDIQVEGAEIVQEALKAGKGVLITPNHSFHYDSYVLFEAAHRIGSPCHVLTAWQVFGMSSPFERWMLQKHGCFSIDREGVDLRAFKQAVEFVKASPHPLVIFPEGDIYHTNDRLTPFRDGAAAIALSAAKRATRPIVCIPTAIKARYVGDPTVKLQELMTRLEQRLCWKPRKHQPLAERLLEFSRGILSLKELEYVGEVRSGAIPDRVRELSSSILTRIARQHGIEEKSTFVPERVKEMRRHHIQKLQGPELPADEQQRLERDLDDLFFVVQLFSYPGDYVAENPTIERIAETLDKFEEDVLDGFYPTVRGERQATVRFGTPIEVPKESNKNTGLDDLTKQLERGVQSLLDEINTSRKQT